MDYSITYTAYVITVALLLYSLYAQYEIRNLREDLRNSLQREKELKEIKDK